MHILLSVMRFNFAAFKFYKKRNNWVGKRSQKLCHQMWQSGDGTALQKAARIRKIVAASEKSVCTNININNVATVIEDNCHLSIRAITDQLPNVKMTICKYFQYSFSFLTFSCPFFVRGRRTFVYKIVHRLVSHVQRWSNPYWTRLELWKTCALKELR